MGFSRLFGSDISQPASATDFQPIISGTASPYSGSADLSSLSAEAPQIVRFVRYRLGEPVLSVYLDNQQIFSAFEDSNIKYTAVVNTYQARNWMATMYGLNKDFNLNDLTNKLPMSQFNFLKRLTENVGSEMSPPVGGTQNIRKAYVVMNVGQQDYDLYNDFIDYNSTSSIASYLSSVSSITNSLKLNLKNVYHYSPITLYRFYDPYSSINTLSQEFNFESFNTETIFYVMPIWTDILRAQQLNMSDKVRRSNFSFEVIGNRFRIYPKPKIPMNLYIDYMTVPNPFQPEGSLSADPSINGISNLSNIPFKDIPYNQLNSIAKNWIRHYALALCTEMEGRIRRHFKTIPIPGKDISMDGEELVREGIDLQQSLEKELRDDLEKLTNKELMKAESEMMQSINEQQKSFPMMVYMMCISFFMLIPSIHLW